MLLEREIKTERVCKILFCFLIRQVLENKWLLLDSKMFASNDATTSALRSLLYTVVSPFQYGDGFLQHIDRPFQPVRFFTQEDVNNNRIRYKSPIIGSNEKEVSFVYTGKY